jgi:hypothetical protein
MGNISSLKNLEQTVNFVIRGAAKKFSEFFDINGLVHHEFVLSG